MYKCNFHLPDGMVNITEEGIEVVMPNRHLTPEELAAAAIINECIQKLRGGKFVSYEFNPLTFEDTQKLMKCEWLRSGRLKVWGPTDKPRHYVEDTDAAILEPRTFTCKMALIPTIPHSRTVTQTTAAIMKNGPLVKESVSTGNSEHEKEIHVEEKPPEKPKTAKRKKTKKQN